MGAERVFRVMGSDAQVIVVGGSSHLIDTAEQRTRDLERRWSRFLDTSEVSRLNREAGQFVAVSSETVELIRAAQQAWRMSGGAFDPTVLGAMIRAGYDRSFDQIGPATTGGTSVLGIGVADIEIDGQAVRLPPRTGFDPGGIGKGLAADMVSGELIEAGAEGVCVSLGGDVRVRGNGPEGGAWTLAVQHPWSKAPIAVLGLADGAVATSTTLRRTWTIGGETRHHLIDPQTGSPSDTDLTLATAVAANAATAEVMAKAVLLTGAAHPFDILGGTGIEAIACARDGRVLATHGLGAYLGAGRPVERLATAARERD